MILTSQAKTPAAARDDIARLLEIRRTSVAVRLHMASAVKLKIALKAEQELVDDLLVQINSIIFPHAI